MTDRALAADADRVTAADPAAAIAAVAAALKARRAVPYLGPGAFALLPPEECPIPRNAAELTQRLNAKVTAPGRFRANLTAVAQFIETRRHRKTLEAILDGLFRHAAPATPVHRLLAAIPAPPMIVDVWYDDALASLLGASAGRSWGQIQGVSHPQSSGEWVRYYAADGTEALAGAADGWETVLYKPSGAATPVGNYLISDSDYVEILTEIDIQTPIPPVVKERRTGRHFVYLGCRFDHEIQRTFGRQIAKRSSEHHWAVIQGELSRNEERFLSQNGITRIDLPLDVAVEMLEEAMG